MHFILFFFSSRRRHTRCGRDWSSDVCSSDLGVSEAAADGAAVADRTIGDGRGHLAQHLAARKPQILQTGVGHAGADALGATHVFQSLQRLEPRDIDQERRSHEPQIQHRSERLSARQKLGPFCVRQGGQCLGYMTGTYIVEARSLHAVFTRGSFDGLARLIASSSRRGVSGVSVSSTPSGRNASFTALKITAGGAIAPPSPMPLMPNSVYGEG